MSSKNGCTRQLLLALFLCLTTTSLAQALGGEDLDVYKWRVSGLWWFSNPTGSFTGKDNSGTFDLSRDFDFGSYSTFSGLADWRFKRKHHILFGVSPVISSQRTTISRTIEYQGVTYNVGTSVAADIKSSQFPPATSTTSFGATAYLCPLQRKCICWIRRRTFRAWSQLTGNPKSRRHQDQFLLPCQ